MKRDTRDPAVIDGEILLDAEASRQVPVADTQRLRTLFKDLGFRTVKLKPTH